MFICIKTKILTYAQIFFATRIIHIFAIEFSFQTFSLSLCLWFSICILCYGNKQRTTVVTWNICVQTTWNFKVDTNTYIYSVYPFTSIRTPKIYIDSHALTYPKTLKAKDIKQIHLFLKGNFQIIRVFPHATHVNKYCASTENQQRSSNNNNNNINTNCSASKHSNKNNKNNHTSCVK